ncbi:MAG: ATP-dependent DNA ligase [Terriglobia bacterium]|nr:ATP-dependent DNA ligase [Terriglobia bacterium]
MDTFAATCEAAAATTKKTEKTRIVADYLRSLGPTTAPRAAQFLAGQVFPVWEERTLQLGGAQLWRAIAAITGKSERELSATYRRYGDLGSAAADVLRGIAPKLSELSIADLEAVFDNLASARDTVARMAELQEILSRLSPLGAKYFVKLITGDMRIGLKESLVEEAVAKAWGRSIEQVQRANMLLGDLAETTRLAIENRLSEARLRLFHPIGFMLASPAADSAEAFEYFEHARVEDKYDGIRAQAHTVDQRVRIFSRTRDDITESFPELVPWLAALPRSAVLDGEILAWDFDEPGGRALPFSSLQKRLGRKRVSRTLLRDIPVAYVVFDVLHLGGELIIDETLRVRNERLNLLFATPLVPATGEHAGDRQSPLFAEENPHDSPRVLRAPAWEANSPAELDRLFEQAQARGNEGLMIKDLNSPYLPGRRGRSWLKLKRELATLDVIVTAVEYGHGKRAKVLSDYTFAVRDGHRLRNVGKAYTGLTDVEIAKMTQWFLAHTLTDHGWVREVEPKIVLEVAFNAVMESDRHDSGYALRFPRIVRLRDDKSADEIDTIDRVREIFERQKRRGSAAS